MKFLHHLFSSNKPTGFDKIEGYEDIKNIIMRALDSEDNYNLLFIGAPARAKTLFLLGILELQHGVYFDGSNTTNRILYVLEQERPKVICIDELDKMPRQFQNQLSNFMESGRVKDRVKDKWADRTIYLPPPFYFGARLYLGIYFLPFFPLFVFFVLVAILLHVRK